jgi:hypothetical protein
LVETDVDRDRGKWWRHTPLQGIWAARLSGTAIAVAKARRRVERRRRMALTRWMYMV